MCDYCQKFGHSMVVVPMNIWCDNIVAIGIVKNHVHHNRTKHAEIDCHFIKDKIESGLVELSYTSTNHQVADLLTKSLPRVRFEELSSKTSLINIYSPTWWGLLEIMVLS